MVKFIHCADVHILGGFNAPMPSAAAEKLEAANMAAFTGMLDAAVADNTDFVVIAGDLFQAQDMDLYNMDKLRAVFKKYPKLDFYITAGNKDEFFENSWYDLYDFPSNVTVFKSRWDTVEKPEYTVSGFSLYKGDKAVSADGLKLPAQKFNVAVVHGCMSGVLPKYPYNIIDFSALAAKRVNYIAAGHVHKHEKGKAGEGCTYAYPGSLVPRSFEENHPHGYMKCSFDGTLKTEFVEVNDVACHTVTLDLGGELSAGQQEQLVIEKGLSLPKNSVVKFILKGESTLSDMLGERKIINALRDRFLYLEIDNRITLSERFLRGVNTVSLPGSFVHIVNTSENLSEDDRQMVLKYGLQALRAEDNDI